MTISFASQCTAMVVAVQLLSAAALSAQDSSRASADVANAPKQCWRGQPSPACEEFLITEIGFYYRMIRPSALVPVRGEVGVPPRERRYRVASKFIAAELGGMKNFGKRSAVGFSLSVAGEGYVIGNEFTASYGAKARYRRWQALKGTSMEFGVGVQSQPDRFRTTERGKGGLTADVAINATDHLGLVLRYEDLRVNGKNRPSLSFGIRPGAQTGFFTAAAILATGLIAEVLISSGDW